MSGVLPPWPLLAAFLAASVVLAVTPGPGVLYIVTRSLSQGRASGLASVAGVALGNLGNAAGAALGLGALLAASSTAFLIVKYAGACYLVYLGIQALRSRPAGPQASPPRAERAAVVFRDGLVVALLNPKTAVFFAAFLPQFMSADAAPLLQSLALGALFVLVAASTDTLYALGASALAPVLLRRRAALSAGRYVAGGAFIGLGLFAALSPSRGVLR